MLAPRSAPTEFAVPYRERCYAAGRKLVGDMDPILPELASRAGETEALGRMPDACMAIPPYAESSGLSSCAGITPWSPSSYTR